MDAKAIDADVTTWISRLKRLSISTTSLAGEGHDDLRQNTAVLPISNGQHRNLKRPFLHSCADTTKKRQPRDNPSRSKDAKLTRKRGQRCLPDHASPPLLWLPVELRLVIFRMVLGDRKIHVHYKQGLHSDPNRSREQMAFTQYLPQYVFCHHDAFMDDSALRLVMKRVNKSHNHHDLCTSPSLSLDKKVASAFNHIPKPKTTIPSPKTIELMYESFELRLSIFAVSRHFREEAIEVYYGTNTFSFATASFFNIFISRLTDAKALMLRKIECIYDRGDLYTLGDKNKETTQPPRWRLGGQNPDILKNLANINDITIRYCNLYSVTRRKVWKDSKMLESTQLHERLRRDFGGLCRLKGVTRVDV